MKEKQKINQSLNKESQELEADQISQKTRQSTDFNQSSNSVQQLLFDPNEIVDNNSMVA